ncbi:hypothetical protein [Marinobacter mobilis]|uniref:hypothetical protein n=1 Tax=Marinobacter mobilis TaxID=488533 RepID=UPI0035C6C0AB
MSHLEATLDYVCTHYPRLAAGEPGLTMDATAVDSLMQEACQTNGGQGVKDKQRYLVKVLTRGVKELRWQLPVPSPVQTVHMFPSLTTPDMAARVDDYDRINDAFLAGLQVTKSDDTTIEDMEWDAGELLFSFVFHSGVISRRWFNRLSEAIRSGAGSYGDETWLELGHASAGNSSGASTLQCRRVILSPITMLLLRRWYLRWGKEWPYADDQDGRQSTDEILIRRFVDVLIGRFNITLHRRLDIFAIAEANLVTVTPGFLVHYARTPDLGASLSLSNWMRLISSGTTVQSKLSRIQNDRENVMVGSPTLIPPGYPLSDQRPIFNRLLKLLRPLVSASIGSRGKTEKGQNRMAVELAKMAIFKKIDRLASKEGSSVLLQLMCHHCRVLLRADELVPVSLQQKIRDFRYLKALLPFATDIQDPESLDGDEWQSIYESVTSECPGDAGELRRALFDWHEFLHQYYGVPRVPTDNGASYGVDAAILTPVEYHKAKAFLMARPEDELACIQLALLIMGFRCGLRRTECWARQYGDFHGLGDPAIRNPEMLVRPTKLAGVKSDAAIRRLPLCLLLTAEELDWLAGFVRKRQLLRANNNVREPVFADPVSGTFRVTEAQAFDGLTAVLKCITGDDDARFHQLRHSFASLALMRLLERKPFDFMPKHWAQSNGVELMPVLHDRTHMGTAGLSNPWRALSQLSQWMGHSSERVTLKSYSHLLDFLLGQYRLRDDPSLTVAQQAVLLDKSVAALERFRHRARLTDRMTPVTRLAAFVRMPAKGLMKLPTMSDQIRPLPVALHKVADDVNPLLPYRLACQTFIRTQAPHHESQSVALAKAASQLDLELPIAKQWYERAVLLMGSSTGRDGKRLRFSLRSKAELTNASFANTYTLIFRSPELPTYTVPPQSKVAFNECMKLFKWLSDWMAEEPEVGKKALIAAAESVQRSKAELRPRGSERQIAFMALMRKLRFGSRVVVTLTVKEESKKEALRFWAQNLSVTQNAIIVQLADGQQVGEQGNVSFEWKVTHKLGKHFWHVIRFVVFTGCILYDAVPESFRTKPAEIENPGEECEESAVPG